MSRGGDFMSKFTSGPARGAARAAEGVTSCPSLQARPTRGAARAAGLPTPRRSHLATLYLGAVIRLCYLCGRKRVTMVKPCVSRFASSDSVARGVNESGVALGVMHGSSMTDDNH
eukprot:1178993-Prorocentrum_minimum.AAC.3